MHVAMTISLMLLDLLGLLNLLGLLGLLNLFQERVGQGPCDSPFHGRLGLSGLSGRFGLLGLLGFLGLLPSSMVVVVSMVVRFTTTGSETKVQGNT
jgi:hypothetical protein